MDIKIFPTKSEMGKAAAKIAADAIRDEIAATGQCSIILATGASQFDTLEFLVAERDIDWSKVTAFHLDEYIGISDTHPASFRKYLKERFVDKVPTLGEFIFVDGTAGDIRAECERVGKLLNQHKIAVACIGIGENGHIAFNDPPADFDTETPYIIVQLDEACRRQQLGEGWFDTFDDVPTEAISMSISNIMKAAKLVVSVPDSRKATAVANTVKQEISPDFPSTILRNHSDCTLLLDEAAASQLDK